MQDVIFVHGMFQNPKSWAKWTEYFSEAGFNCIVPPWPLHEGEPSALRENPPAGLGDLSLEDVISSIERVATKSVNPIMIGHSVGGLVTQILLSRGVISTGVAISSVVPNAMTDLDWGFMKNTATIANPLKGNEPVYMDPDTFHQAFANTMSSDSSRHAFEAFATHDSRNVLRACMGSDGRVDLDKAHGPLLLIAGEKDEIIPAHLNEKNFKAYSDKKSITAFKEFKGRSHYICGEPGWEAVAEYALNWVNENAVGVELSPARRAS